MEERRVCDKIAFKKRILTAANLKKAPLVLKGARVLNVFTEEFEEADVAISDGYIVGIGAYEGVEERDYSGIIICPAFIDVHIHLESSMVSPADFEQAVLPHGTAAVVTDPHEITNVAGITTFMTMAYILAVNPNILGETGMDSGAVFTATALSAFIATILMAVFVEGLIFILLSLTKVREAIFLAIPSFVTAPALVVVGFLMLTSIAKIDFSDFTEALPAYIAIIAMPFMYSISEGIAMGVISYVVINLATGKAKEKKISALMYVFAILFVLKYIFL